MKEQNLKNHSRYIPLWHFIIPFFMLVLLIFAIINFVHADADHHYSAAILLLISILLFGFYWYTRWFALRAQDRAIRAEENFRHFLLTGKPLDSRLHTAQIIALRFASDEELPGLANRAAEQNMSQKEIKTAIKNWRPDYHRV